MKKLSILWLLVLALPCFAQNTKAIKPADTLYIYFDHGKGQEKFYHKFEDNEQLNSSIYNIYFNDDQWSLLSFGHMGMDKPDVRLVRKSFLRKNKSKILKAAELRKHDLKDAVKMIGGRVTYIIDTEDFKKGTIMLRQVRTGSSLNDFEM